MGFKMQGMEYDGGSVTISVARYEKLRDMADKEKKWQVHPHGPFGVSYLCKDADFKKLLDKSLESEIFLLKSDIALKDQKIKMLYGMLNDASLIGRIKRLF